MLPHMACGFHYCKPSQSTTAQSRCFHHQFTTSSMIGLSQHLRRFAIMESTSHMWKHCHQPLRLGYVALELKSTFRHIIVVLTARRCFFLKTWWKGEQLSRYTRFSSISSSTGRSWPHWLCPKLTRQTTPSKSRGGLSSFNSQTKSWYSPLAS